MAFRTLFSEERDNHQLEGQSWVLDSTTKLNICSDQNGASSLYCKVSQLDLFYFNPEDPLFSTGYFSGVARIILVLSKNIESLDIASLAAFYPLVDGSLADTTHSLGSAYFGIYP